jgi:hypothetical protein
MAHDEHHELTLGERLSGRDDPKEPDGLVTVDEVEHPKSHSAYGHAETDTLANEGLEDAPSTYPLPGKYNGITASDTNL